MYNDILKMIEKSDVVSFDIFDTLLFRNLYSPTDIFKIMEEKLKIEKFYKYRVGYASRAREKEHCGVFNPICPKIKCLEAACSAEAGHKHFNKLLRGARDV
jgi:predicted HAD superfamily hydrolase